MENQQNKTNVNSDNKSFVKKPYSSTYANKKNITRTSGNSGVQSNYNRRPGNTSSSQTGTSFYKRKNFFSRKKFCFICYKSLENKVNYLDTELLGRFVTERGKIMPSRYTGNCARHQRLVKKHIKRARMLCLMPFLSKD